MLHIQQIIYSDHCRRETEHILARKICADGRPLYGWLCTESGEFSSTVLRGKSRKWIKQFEAAVQCFMRGAKIADLPTVGEPDRTPCAKCKSTGGVQLHHIMPQSIDGDADGWGTVPLCIKCHADLHRKLDVRKLKEPTCN